ncbi:MAG: aminoacetone oxidase family FAD-binding enzyme, partial [Rikenellaceae bacterium]
NLNQAYPRGERLIRQCFKSFDYNDTYEWFEREGVALTTQDDCCVFPLSQSSQQIIDTFVRLSGELKIDVVCNFRINKIEKEESLFILKTDNQTIECDIVVATTGGSRNTGAYDLYQELPLQLEELAPSLFGFDIADKSLCDVAGAVVEAAEVRVKGSRAKACGALLITHWGVSGPVVLNLSAYVAKDIKDCGYKFQILINWSGQTEDSVLREIRDLSAKYAKKLISSTPPFNLTSRLWEHIIGRAKVPLERRWSELGSKGINRIVATLISDEYDVVGRSRQKPGFTTAGGVSLKSINTSTLEARNCQRLFLAGEVLDVDAITGGFNFQAAWSTAYCVAKSIHALYEE